MEEPPSLSPFHDISFDPKSTLVAGAEGGALKWDEVGLRAFLMIFGGTKWDVPRVPAFRREGDRTQIRGTGMASHLLPSVAMEEFFREKRNPLNPL
jgi:hypothetical protein